MLPVIEWQPSADGNVQVLNDTSDFYRYFDATAHAEFLYSCVMKTIDVDLPHETQFLAQYDQFRARIENLVDMPDRIVDLLFRCLHQNGGRLSRRACEQEFAALTEQEVATAERAYGEIFGGAASETSIQT